MNNPIGRGKVMRKKLLPLAIATFWRASSRGRVSRRDRRRSRISRSRLPPTTSAASWEHPHHHHFGVRSCGRSPRDSRPGRPPDSVSTRNSHSRPSDDDDQGTAIVLPPLASSSAAGADPLAPPDQRRIAKLQTLVCASVLTSEVGEPSLARTLERMYADSSGPGRSEWSMATTSCRRARLGSDRR